MKMEEWKECKFKDLYRIPSKNGLSKPSRIRGSGYKMINMGELFSNDRIYNIPMELVPLTDTEKENAKVEVNDLLFARQSLIVEGAGKCSIVMETDELTVFESHIIRVRLNPELAYPPFFYYYFKNKNSPIRAIIQHCVQAGIKASDLAEITVKLPPLPTQQKIAAILSSLDDKIELNNKINTNLEQQAGALFKNWFVDFEPFGGKMPEGWKVGKLSDIAEITSGKRPPMKQSDYSKDVSIPLVGAASVMGYTNQVLYNEPILITGRVGTHGVIQRFSTECWPSDNTLVVKSQYYEYVYQIMCNIDYDNMNRGSTQPLITQSDLGKVECIIPDEGNLNKFEQLTNNLFAKVQENQLENQKLANIRDTLLPKLMNGEIIL